MRPLMLAFVAVVLLLAGPAVYAENRVDIGGSIVNGNLNNFYLAIGEHYRTPLQQVIVVRERHIPDPEIPVVYFLARQARVAPEVIVDLRLHGNSWMDITLRYGLSPEIYYVPVTRAPGPPFGHAYGHYKKKHRKEWKNLRLDDDDVIELVNVRFLSERYHRTPDEVVRLRTAGNDFYRINDEMRGGERERDKKERKEEKKREKEYKKEHKHGDKHGHKHRDD